MPSRRQVDRSLYGWKPVHRRDGVPWPRIAPELDSQPTRVPLKEDYLLRSMDYLDTDEALPIFSTIADFIMKKQMRGIVDVGCRIGRFNDVLHDRGYQDYQYMGFDTSEQPIDYSQHVWEEFKNIEFRHASWDQRGRIQVDFPVDCVVWSGVLLYRPQDHLELFEELTRNFYGARWAIIQEPMSEQKHWSPGLSLQTIESELWRYKERYKNFDEVIVDAPIFSGRRKIALVEL